MKRLVMVMLVVGCVPSTPDVPVASRAQPLVAVPEPVSDDQARAAHDAFRAWVTAWSSAPAKRPELEVAGVQLAQVRRPLFAALLLSNPELALTLAVNPVERASLPPAVQAELEQWRDGVGTVHVVGGVSDDGHPIATDHLVTFAGSADVLRAGVFGARAHDSTRERARLHGVALDGVIALTNERLRRLFPGELARDLPLERPRTCPTSRKLADPNLVYDGGDANYGFCSMEMATQFEQTLITQDAVSASGLWTQGSKTVLFIRADFSDHAGDPVAQTSVESVMNTQVTPFYEAASYGKTTQVTTVTPTIRLPKTQAQYQANQDYLTLMSDARAAAKAAGFDTANYDLDVIAFAATFSGGWAGRGYVGSKGVWLNGYFDLRVIGHEMGHNYGVNHANYWQATGLTIIGPGTNVEYGNPFDMMSSVGGANSHFNAWFKRLYDWVPSAEAGVVTASGTYRINALEQPIASGFHGLKIARDPVHDYWLEFRPGFNNTWVQNGASINWGYHYNTGSHLLDMTPGDNDRSNSALLIGRTFSDPVADLYLTPIGKVTAPAALDVVVNVGPFPGNHAPTVTMTASTTTPTSGQVVTFTATASDPDGDALAYAWTFDDGSFGPNTAVATKSFSAARAYTVLLTVSDMKGLTSTTSVVVTVGAPATFTLSGAVLAGGTGVEGVRISDGTRVTFTRSDGHYDLTNVPAGNETITADKVDFTCVRSFAAPLPVAASMSGLDFTASAVAGYLVQGKVTGAGVNLPNVVVTDGVRTATTNATGDFSLGPVPTGRYTLSATLPGWNLIPSGFTNPLDVIGGDVTAVNFSSTGAYLSGSIPAAGVTVAPVVTDGVRTATATLGGTTWYWSLNSVPNGTWNVTATSTGVTLVPTFLNPVAINAGMGVSNLNFVVGSGGGVSVSGQVKTGGTPLPGVVVSDGTQSSVTDSLGRYVLSNEAAGAFTLTPTLAGYTFVPATRAITVASTPLTGQDFATTVVNLPPTLVTAASATPNPVVTGSTTLLTALGADDGGEAALTYRWTASGTGYPVSFSANGTNAAKSATATFTGAGYYTIECVITDAGGLSVRSQLQVQVQPVPTSATITPASATVSTGATQSLIAQLQDQFGRPTYQGAPAWTTSAGSLSTANGWNTVFTAGVMPGPVTVQVSVSGKSASAVIVVTSASAPMITSAATATPNPVTAKTTSVSVRATDDGGEPALSYSWAMSAGPGSVSFAPNATNAAKDAVATFTASGSYDLLVTVRDADGNTSTSTVTVVVEATPTAIDVQPAVLNLQVGQQQAFTATVSDQFGLAIASQPTVSWTATGGTVDATGLYTAGLTAGGPFVVTATVGALTGNAQLTLGAVPDTTPPTVTLTAPLANAQVGGSTVLTATASDNVGVAQVEFFLDGVTSLGVASAMPWTTTFDFSGVSAGVHTLTAKATDAAGNSATSDGVTVTVGVVDTAAPTVRITSPVMGAVNSLEVSVTAEASDDLGVTALEFELDGATVKSLTGAPWSAVLTVAEGDHSLVAIAHDASGKFTRSDAVSFSASTTVKATTPDVVVGSCGCSNASGLDGLVLVAVAVFLLRPRRQ